MLIAMGEHTDADLAAWDQFVEALSAAGRQVAADTAELSDVERADGFRALLRAVANQLGRFEVDRERPELVAFNGWRQKFLMDNPDFGYWVADIRDDRRYRLVGERADAVYVSITAYAVTATGAQATARVDSDALTVDAAGRFDLAVGGERPASGDWLELPAGARAVWVRFFYNDADTDRQGWCAIEPVDTPAVPAPIDPPRFRRALQRLGATTAALPQIIAAATAEDRQRPNEIRPWSQMTGGAVFTEPDISYLRGAWRLEPGEALLVEGEPVACRYWNILAYSRFLNSLDYRYRPVSYTGATATLVDGRYRFVLAADDPGAGDWIDTEGRGFGIVVLRFLQPAAAPPLPSVRRVRLADLPGRR